MVLAAGRGERMRPLTDKHPKPLLHVQGQPLICYPLQALCRAGVNTAVINTGWLGDQIEPVLGKQFVSGDASSPLQLLYSHEGRGAGEALETAGGIVRALPLLEEVFWVCAGDVFAPDFPFSAQAHAQFKASTALAHIWLVPNPPHHPSGDFGVSPDGLALNPVAQQTAPSTQSSPVASPVNTSVAAKKINTFTTFTFSTIALYKHAFFQADWCSLPAGNPQGAKAPLAPMLRAAIDQGLVSASVYLGTWVDVGTPERLALLNASPA